MKKNYLIYALIILFIQASCSDSNEIDPFLSNPEEDVVISRDGWVYYGGDEFNDAEINRHNWGLYGDAKVGNSKYGQDDHKMLQTYRPSQVSIETLSTSESVCRIKSIKSINAPIPSKVENQVGWWSGALSSRDSHKNDGVDQSKYYPLFCRIEIKAKIPYIYGIWPALWARHYLGATEAAELDIEEFFVKQWKDPYPAKLSQALHLWNTEKNKMDMNVVKNDRHIEIGDDKPGDRFHIYGVQVEPDPRSSKKHAIITFFIDDKVNYKFETYNYGDRYNKFVKKAFEDKREQRTWDIAITGQIGGEEEILNVGYPADNLTEIITEIDWVRVYVPSK